jgi:hypothetical protein
MFASNAEIARIANGLKNRTLPRSEWTHAAHFAAAVWLLRSPDDNALRDMPGLIRAYNEACGLENSECEGYHETITLASIYVARQISLNLPEITPAYKVTNAILASEFGKSDWILKYWTPDRLFSVSARRRWSPPDLMSLPRQPEFVRAL